MTMHMTERLVDGVTVLDLSGKLAGDAIDPLAERLDAFLANGRHRVLLNLGEVRFLDSGVLGLLVSKRAEFLGRGGKLKLLNVSVRISDLLVTTKLERMFETYDTEGEALQSFAA